jgi:secreted trypsin-like serine protease
LCEIDGNVVLAGITSWGIGCARAGNPGEWSKVSNYISWLEPRLAGALTPFTTKTSTTTTTNPFTSSDKARIRRYCSSNTAESVADYTDVNLTLDGKMQVHIKKIEFCRKKKK